MLRVISWNLLNDIHASKHGSQKDRFAGAVDELKKHVVDYPMAIFLFEITDKNRFKGLADNLGFKHFDQTKYSNDWVGVATNYPLDKFDQIKHDGSKLKYKKDRSALINYQGQKISCTHMPHYIFVDEPTRFKFARDLIDEDVDIAVGDFNATYINPSRLIFKAKGYKNAWPTQKPRDTYPAPGFRGKNIPYILPNARIDAHYYKGMKLQKHFAKNTAFSDHPLLVSDFIKE